MHTNTIKLSTNLEILVASLESLCEVTQDYESNYISLPINTENLLPSIVHVPKFKLKLLLSHSKYIYLRDNDTLSVIIANHLSQAQENKLLRVIRDHKIVIGWTIIDIKGINLSICIHRILLEDKTKPIRGVQCKLNSLMIEVLKKEILKWLDVGIIYLISYSK